MMIKRMISQHRRDFYAIYVCEHCKHEVEMEGYDDDNFHRNVIPDMECEKCKKKSPKDYRGLQPKYSPDVVI